MQKEVSPKIGLKREEHYRNLDGLLNFYTVFLERLLYILKFRTKLK